MPDVLAQAVIAIGGQIAADFASELVGKLEDVQVEAGDTAKALEAIQGAADAVGQVASAGFNSVSTAAQKASGFVGNAGTSVQNAADTLNAYGLVSDDTADQIQGVSDALTATQGALDTVSQLTSTASQLVSTYAGSLTKLPAVQKAVALGQKAINLAMKANPIGLIITAITLLVAGLVLAYKKSETFRNIVDKAFQGVKAAALAVFGFITKYIQTQIKIWTTIFGAVKKVIGGIWDGLKSAGQTAFNGLLAVLRPIATLINKLIRGFNRVSGAVGGFTIPEIPKFASGVRNFRGGLAIVGEQGPELVNLPRGSDVIPNDQISGVTQHNTYIFQGPESFAGARRDATWAATQGTRFGSATRAILA